MTVVIGAVVGFIAGRMLWLALQRTWQQDALLRKNFQGNLVPTAAGVVLLLALTMVEGLRALLSGGGEAYTGPRLAVLVAVAGFTVLGLLDDLLGERGPKGFAGHLRALAGGQLTSGGVKLLGGATLSLVAASIAGADGVIELLAGAGVIALAANLFNLFDLRPGRTTKVAAVTFIVLAIATALDAGLLPVAVVIGAAVALLRDELHERLMLGDTGANAIGAAIGVGMVVEFGLTGTLVALAVLAALNLLSEIVSFSSIIEKTPGLKTLDRLGRSKPATVDVREAKDEKTIRLPADAPRDMGIDEDPEVVGAKASPFERRPSLQEAATGRTGGEHFERKPQVDDLFGDDFDAPRREDRDRRNPVEDDRPEWPF